MARNRWGHFTKSNYIHSLCHRWNETLVKSVCKQHQNPCSGSPPVYQDLSMCYDWPVKKAIVDLPIKMKGNWKYISGNSLSLLVAQNKGISTASQTLLTEVTCKLCLWQCAFFSSMVLREITFRPGKSCNRRNLTLEHQPPCLSSNKLNTT